MYLKMLNFQYSRQCLMILASHECLSEMQTSFADLAPAGPMIVKKGGLPGGR